MRSYVDALSELVFGTIFLAISIPDTLVFLLGIFSKSLDFPWYLYLSFLVLALLASAVKLIKEKNELILGFREDRPYLYTLERIKSSGNNFVVRFEVKNTGEVPAKITRFYNKHDTDEVSKTNPGIVVYPKEFMRFDFWRGPKEEFRDGFVLVTEIDYSDLEGIHNYSYKSKKKFVKGVPQFNILSMEAS